MRFLFRPPAADATGLLTLPWDEPLAEWDPALLLEVPQRGISRHVVRFVATGGQVFALKEINERLARHEYALLGRVRGGGAADGLGARHLRRPARRPGGDPGDPLPRVLDVLPLAVLPSAAETTRPSSCSTRWWSCWSGCTWPGSSGATARCRTRCSGSTPAPWPPTWSTPRPSERYPTLSPGQRAYDVDLARERVGAELLDLRFGGLLPDGHRPDRDRREPAAPLRGAVGRGDPRGGLRRSRSSSTASPSGCSGSTTWASTSARWSSSRPTKGPSCACETRVAEPGQHRRELFRLTGLEVQERQARRLLNDIRAFRA